MPIDEKRIRTGRLLFILVVAVLVYFNGLAIRIRFVALIYAEQTVIVFLDESGDGQQLLACALQVVGIAIGDKLIKSTFV